MQVDTFYGKIIEITEYDVTMEILLDTHKDIVTEKRVFSIAPFKNHIPLNIDTFVMLQYTTSPGEIRVTFNEMTNEVIQKILPYFEYEIPKEHVNF